jgi:hypothetical protein
LDKQKDRLKGGLSLLLLYEVYDKCWCNALFFTGAFTRWGRPLDARDRRHVVIGHHLDRARVDMQDFRTAHPIGQVHADLAIKAARAEQRRVEHLGPVRHRPSAHVIASWLPVDLLASAGRIPSNNLGHLAKTGW